MKHLKRFENFDLGRFSEIEDENAWTNDVEDIEEDEFNNEIQGEEEYDGSEEEEDFDEEEDERRRRVWGDEEIVEKKKINSGFQAYLDKQKEKSEKKNDKDSKSKKEDKDEKDDKKDTKSKGLSAKQKKLPDAMQKAILKRMNK